LAHETPDQGSLGHAFVARSDVERSVDRARGAATGLQAWQHDRAMADLLHVRIIVPAELRTEVLSLIEASEAICDLTVFDDAARRPRGDVVQFDVAREAINELLDELEERGVHERGSITVFSTELTLSRFADRVQERAPGEPSDTVVWDEVAARLRGAVRPNLGFLAFFAVAAVIAAVGIISDSSILIVGAMVVGPEYGPLAAMAFGLHRRDGQLLRLGAWCFALGAALGVVTGLVVAVLTRLLGQVPDAFVDGERPLTGFITDPDLFTLLVAAAAAVAGMLALTQDRGGTLVGVLISVTTIPAIAGVGVGIAFGDGDDVVGALTQLAVNVVCIVLVGALMLSWLRRSGRHPHRRVAHHPVR